VARASRIIAVATAVLALAAWCATPSVAGTRQLVTGDAKGNAPFIFGAGCSFVRQHYVGDVQRGGGAPAHVDVDVCVDLPSGAGFPARGTFVMHTNRGDVRGNVIGEVDAAQIPCPFAFDLAVKRTSPGVVARVGEVLHFTGSWSSDSITGGPFTGRVTDG
jgi:hypothetical protein